MTDDRGTPPSFGRPMRLAPILPLFLLLLTLGSPSASAEPAEVLPTGGILDVTVLDRHNAHTTRSVDLRDGEVVRIPLDGRAITLLQGHALDLGLTAGRVHVRVLDRDRRRIGSFTARLPGEGAIAIPVPGQGGPRRPALHLAPGVDVAVAAGRPCIVLSVRRQPAALGPEPPPLPPPPVNG